MLPNFKGGEIDFQSFIFLLAIAKLQASNKSFGNLLVLGQQS
ncbi:MAG: hypothetical protein WA919_15285 [Coleofasciculaceae cyanobacterium]